ncbi:MAG TPA: hypothetical protein VGK92_12180 [Gaiellales bacterium]
MSALETVGEIREGYRHVPKVVHPAPVVEAGGALLKWYDIAEGLQPVPREIKALAGEGLDAIAEQQSLAGELGFVILHRCGDAFFFLIVTTWRNENEAWTTVWVKASDDEPAFRPWPLDGAGHHPAFCVWELRAVCHESGAWSRYLRSGRDARAKKEYLSDAYTGSA